MRVAIVFDDVESRASATADECGVLEAVAAVEESLRVLGHQSLRVPVNGLLQSWLAELERAAPDLVFNLCEGVNGWSELETHAAAVVELLGIPSTGSSAETLALARHKDRVNAILANAGLQVPEWRCIDGDEMLSDWDYFPAIVKPAAEDASVGISQRSVARNPAELATALTSARPFAPLMVQQFIAGRELNVGIVAEQVLPIAEIDFGALPPEAWPIVSYRAKWETGSDEDRGTRPVCPALLDEASALRVRDAAVNAWRVLDGRGYCRVDFRLALDGTAFLLEVNPNPDLAPAAGLSRMALAAGWSYVELIARIIDDTLARTRSRPQAATRREPQTVAVR